MHVGDGDDLGLETVFLLEGRGLADEDVHESLADGPAADESDLVRLHDVPPGRE